MDKLSQKIDKVPAATLIIIGCLAQAMIGVFVKYLVQTDLGIYNQILLRNIIAGLLGLFFVSGSIRSYVKATSKDKIIILLRSLVYITGIYFSTLAIKYTTLANVGMISAFPFVTIMGIIFFKEKADFREWLLILIALIGALMVSGLDMNGLNIGLGQIYAFIYAGLFAVMVVLAKKTTGNISSQQYSVLTQFLVAPFIIFISVMNQGVSDITNNMSWSVLYFALGAGIFIIINMIAMGSGMRGSKTTSANILMYSYPVFSVIVSFVFFGDVPAINEIIGGILIVTSCVLITIRQSKLNLNKGK